MPTILLMLILAVIIGTRYTPHPIVIMMVALTIIFILYIYGLIARRISRFEFIATSFIWMGAVLILTMGKTLVGYAGIGCLAIAAILQVMGAVRKWHLKKGQSNQVD